MHGKGTKFAASYSGGKDSALALYRALRQGMEPAVLLVTYRTDAGRSWFHGLPEAVLNELSAALAIPIRMIPISGEDYADKFAAELRKQKKNGVDVCVFGDIDIDEHLTWCREVCDAAGVEACFPLWKEPREQLVREMIGAGFTATITVVDTTRLSQRHLGMVLSEEAMRSIAAEGADVCGENGEYHSFVSDGPIFRHPVPVSFGPPLPLGRHAVLPLHIQAVSGA